MRAKDLIRDGADRAVNPYHSLMVALEIAVEDGEDGVPVQYTGDIGTVAMAFAMSNLTAREEKVLWLRFFDGMDYEAAGKVFGVTRERIRQVEHKALRKMKWRKNVRQLMSIGITAYWQQEVEQTAQGIADAYKAALDKEYAERVADWEANRESEPTARPDTEAEIERIRRLKMPIEEMDLSVRSYNCLKRGCMNTVEDITLRTYEQMMHVRNLGRKSLDEITQRLTELGFRLAESAEPVPPEFGEKYWHCPVCHRRVDRARNGVYCSCGALLDWRRALKENGLEQ